MPDEPRASRGRIRAAETLGRSGRRHRDDRPATKQPLPVRGKALPESTEGQAQAREGSVRLAAVSARAVTIVAQQPATQRVAPRGEQGEQKRIGQRRQQQELLPRLRVPETRALEGQLTFVFPPGHFNLEAPRIGKHDPPGILGAPDRLVGQQIPRQAPEAMGNDQPQRLLRMIRVTHGQGKNAAPHPEMAAAVPHRPLRPSWLAPRDFPGGPPIALGIQQLILFFPA